MKKLLFLFVLSFIFSCTKSLNKIRICNDYKSFVKINWLQQSNGIYHFKDNPSYWQIEVYKKYVKEECLLGRSKKEIQNMFGKPTKIYLDQIVDFMIYSMDDVGLKVTIYGGNALFFEFKDGKVIGVFTNPGASDIQNSH